MILIFLERLQIKGILCDVMVCTTGSWKYFFVVINLNAAFQGKKSINLNWVYFKKPTLNSFGWRGNF